MFRGFDNLLLTKDFTKFKVLVTTKIRTIKKCNATFSPKSSLDNRLLPLRKRFAKKKCETFELFHPFFLKIRRLQSKPDSHQFKINFVMFLLKKWLIALCELTVLNLCTGPGEFGVDYGVTAHNPHDLH